MKTRDLPDRTLPPDEPPDPDDEEVSGVFAFRNEQLIAVAIASDPLRAAFIEALRDAPYLIGGTEFIQSAGVVVADASDDIDARVRELRKAARTDAALILVLDGERWPPEATAAAEAAGAFACIRTPVAREGVEAILRSANASHTAQTRIADLTRELDLQSHLASIGRFTAGLHHELKNPLSVVEMNVNLLRDELDTLLKGREQLRTLAFAPASERAKRELAAREFLDATESHTDDLADALDDARASLARMRRLFGRLQNFVRREGRALEPVDVASVVNEIRGSAGDALEGVEVEVVTEETVHAHAVRSFLEEILVELATNAAIAARTLSSPRVRFHVYQTSDRVVVSVRDNGPGIVAEKHEKIFEPFYTTRRNDGASGLGLAICREYATNMGAQLSFWSAVGRGSCFRLHLRQAAGPARR